MTRQEVRTVSLALVVIVTALHAAPVDRAAAQELPRGYSVEDVSLGMTGRAKGPNLTSHIVGQSGALGAPGEAFIAFSRTDKRTLGTPVRAQNFLANGINDTDDLAGYADVTGFDDTVSVHAIVQEQGVFRDLGTLPGHSASVANGLNNAGDVVGASFGPNGMRAVLWDKKTGVRDLGTLAGTTESQAFAINNSGDIVGSSGKAGSARAFLWTKQAGMQDLGVLPGDVQSMAYGLNNRGDVVGFSQGPTGTHAFLWSKQDGMRNLGALGGGNRSVAQDISQNGIVVGISKSIVAGSHQSARAFVWSAATGIRDLNDLIPSSAGVLVMAATGINTRGQILALGRSVNNVDLPKHEGWDRAFLLTPVP
jgi:probable HAF family extracellular repeat protein